MDSIAIAHGHRYVSIYVCSLLWIRDVYVES